MVTPASKTQRAVFGFLPKNNGAAIDGALEFGLLRTWARVLDRILARLILSP